MKNGAVTEGGEEEHTVRLPTMNKITFMLYKTPRNFPSFYQQRIKSQWIRELMLQGQLPELQ